MKQAFWEGPGNEAGYKSPYHKSLEVDIVRSGIWVHGTDGVDKSGNIYSGIGLSPEGTTEKESNGTIKKQANDNFGEQCPWLADRHKG